MKNNNESLTDLEIDSLLNILTAFKPGVSLKEALEHIVISVHDVLGFGICILSLVEKDSDGVLVLHRVAAAGVPETVFQKMSKVLTPLKILEDVMREKYSISFSYFIPHQEKSVWQDKLLVHTSALPIPSADGLWHPEDMLLVPLKTYGGVLTGLLSVDAPVSGKIPNLRSVQLLEIFANHAALQIENARLLENANVELQRRNDELESTIESERKLINELKSHSEIDVTLLNSFIDLENVLSILLERSQLLTGADDCSILVVAANREYLKVEHSTARKIEGQTIPMLGSICGWVVRHNHSRLVKDSKNESLYYKIAPDDPDRSEVAVPLRLDNRVVGVLNLQSKSIGAFNDENIEVLQFLADRAGLALRNARYYRDLQTIRQIDVTILRNMDDLGQTLRAILTESLKLVDAQHGNLLLLEGNRLIVRATTGRETIGTALSIEDSVSGMPITMRCSINVGDVDKEPKYKRILTDVHMRSELAVPLLDGDQAIGVLNVESPELNAFGPEHENVLMLLAGQAAVAIRVARHGKELAVLRTIDKTILNSAHDLSRVLNVILTESLNLIDAHHGNLLLLEDDRLVVKATTGKEPIGMELSIADSVSGMPIIDHRTINISDVDKEPKYRRVLTDAYMRSELVVPLLDGNQVVGVLNVESPRLDAFSPQDEHLLETLAGQAAIAIKLARLVEQIRNAQDELIQTESIRAIADATSELVHLIGNKAAPILGCVERIENKIDDESMFEDLQMIKTSALLMRQAKEDLLGPARLLNVRPVMIGDLLKDALAGIYRPSDVTISSKIAKGLPLVNLDASQFSVVIENLVKNSIEAFDPNSREPKWIEIRAFLEEGQQFVRIEVADNGRGISPEIQEKIWLPFYTTKARTGGTGLGLSACLHLLRGMGAELFLSNKVGPGATFTMRIPVISYENEKKNSSD